MTSKILIAGLVAIAFVAGSIMTSTAVFADDDDKKKNGNKALIKALKSIADAINGIDPNVTVDTPVTVEIPTDSIQVDVVGLEGPQGDKGPTGDPGSLGVSIKHVTLLDDTDGNSKGWDPNGNVNFFNIVDDDIGA